jgi:hypothetical protein
MIDERVIPIGKNPPAPWSPLVSAIWGAEITPTEKLILLCLALHGDAAGKNIYPGVRRIAALTGFARSTTETNLAQLLGRGMVLKVRQGHQNAANTYRISIATLLENALSTIPRLGGPGAAVEGVPAIGTQIDSARVPATGTAVPASSEIVPATGTELPSTPPAYAGASGGHFAQPRTHHQQRSASPAAQRGANTRSNIGDALRRRLGH